MKMRMEEQKSILNMHLKTNKEHMHRHNFKIRITILSEELVIPTIGMILGRKNGIIME
jgi:6-pyruvoyl-tetrahydropterin synthase